jgi:outer membrane protein assembly factor BamD (BamD/ComL family)
MYKPLMMFVDGMRHQKRGDSIEALTTYGILTNRYPSSLVADDARYRMAKILDELGNTGESKHILSEIASSSSPLASSARMDLAEMESRTSPRRGMESYATMIETFPQSALTPFARKRIQDLAESASPGN